VASVQSVIDAKDIQIIPGMGLNLGDVLKLILNYWNPDKPLYKQIKANLAAAVAANNPEDICRILTGGDFADAILQAITHILLDKLRVITNALPGCTIDCSGGGPDAANVAKTVLTISVKSFSGDGVNFGALIAETVTNIVCCAVQMGVDFAIRKIGTGKILGKLRERCVKLISGGSQTAQRAIASANSNAGYGTPPASDAQIDAAVQTMGASPQQTARAQAVAVDVQIKALEAEYMGKTSGLREQIRQLDAIYRVEFERELSAAQKAGNTARVNQLKAGLASLDTMKADYQRQAQEIARPYLAQIEALGGQSTQILASAGLTSTVNWRPLQVAAATAVVGAGVVVAAPVLAVAGVVGLLVSLLRRA
jgi:hypothetical protein